MAARMCRALAMGVGLPLLAGLLGQHEVMRLTKPVQARHQRSQPVPIIFGVEKPHTITLPMARPPDERRRVPTRGLTH